MAGALRDGLDAMGLAPGAAGAWWLPSLNTVRLPEGVDDGDVIESLLENHGIEVAGGLGDLAGEVLRIGCMGHSARPGNVLELVGALGGTIDRLGGDVDPGAGLAAARDALE